MSELLLADGILVRLRLVAVRAVSAERYARSAREPFQVPDLGGDGVLTGADIPVVVVGAPVAERAWILPEWIRCLERQTLKPAELCFVYSDSDDDTRQLIGHAPFVTRVKRSRRPYFPRSDRQADPQDKWRARHFSVLRNELRGLFMSVADADVFISLDTDVLLEDPTAIESLVETLYGDRAENPRAPWAWDVVAGSTCLSALGEASHCYNAGFWATFDQTYEQAWRRATQDDVVAYKSPLRIDIPMAFFAIHRHALGTCAYSAHECGEDLGFAQSLRRHKFTVGWRTDVKGRHVWDAPALATTSAA